MGPEAPLVQTTGTLGTWVGDRRRRRPTDVRVLTITGMAAGLTVLFGAPLGAALFALEILHRRGLQYYEALLPALIGSLCGYGVYVGRDRRGTRAGVALPGRPAAARRRPPGRRRRRSGRGAGLGRLRRGDAPARDASTSWFPCRCARPWAASPSDCSRSGRPFALTYGEAQLGGLLTTRLAIGALAVAVMAKLAGTSVTLGSGWKGGFIIPLFFMGAALGQIAAPRSCRASASRC